MLNNPVLSRYSGKDGFAYEEGQRAFAQASADQDAAGPASRPDGRLAGDRPGQPVTIADVLVKSAVCFAVTLAFAFIGWTTFASAPWVLLVAAITGLVLGLGNSFKKTVSPTLVLLYAAAQGLMLGGVSNAYDSSAQANGYSDIVLQAVLGTMTAFAVMLALYGTGLVKVTSRFVRVITVALVSYLVLAVASIVAALLGVGGGWGFYGVPGIGLLVCAAGILLAALCLMLDFERIKQGIRAGQPEREAWRMAFGLLVTLIWLYLEILRFLSILSRGR